MYVHVQCMYVYMWVWRYMCRNSGACHAYVMWAELGHSHLIYVLAVSNVQPLGKWNRAHGFVLSIQFSVYGALLL